MNEKRDELNHLAGKYESCLQTIQELLSVLSAAADTVEHFDQSEDLQEAVSFTEEAMHHLHRSADPLVQAVYRLRKRAVHYEELIPPLSQPITH